MEASAVPEKEEAQDEGMQRLQYSSSSHRELLVWRTLAKVQILSQAVLVLMMVLLVRLCSQCSQPACGEKDAAEHSISSLLPFPPVEGSGSGSGSEQCPLNWILHRGKCYYFSKDYRNWTSSREDCADSRSQLLVIQDQEEKDFIQSQTRSKYHWIGLHNPSPERNWTWVDGSPFNGTLFSVTGPWREGKCVVVKEFNYDSDHCRRSYNWICQKEVEKV